MSKELMQDNHCPARLDNTRCSNPIALASQGYQVVPEAPYASWRTRRFGQYMRVHAVGDKDVAAEETIESST